MIRILFLSLLLVPTSIVFGSKWSSIQSTLKTGAWAIIKPFDMITNEGVIEFTPQGRVKKSMEQMKQEVADSLATIKTSGKYEFPDEVQKILDPATHPDNNAFKKHHINVYWHGTACVPKRLALTLMHYYPTAYIATMLKWLTLTALIGTGIEEGTKLLKKWHAKRQKQKSAPQDESNPVRCEAFTAG